jgi:queuine tRNA-ribosyltransferase
MNFRIEKKLKNTLARAGVISTSHGDILTPSYIAPATKATIKALLPEQVKELGADAVLANTYHLYLQPGSELVKKAGDLHKFMNWPGPTFTDSGGFQVFSLGASFGKGIGKILNSEPGRLNLEHPKGSTLSVPKESLVKITEDGVEFRSHIDGSKHFFTPEKSMQIQHDLGADIILAFDECTSPTESYEYQKQSLERTHRWAERSLAEHRRLNLLDAQGLTLENPQALFGIVQGGRHQDLRELSAKKISSMNFDGYAIGGSFDKADMGTAVSWVNKILPEDKPRHLLGIGAVEDLFLGVENGVDTFDCVSPTREARNGALYTKQGRISVLNAKYRTDLTPIEPDCVCYTCKHYTSAYLAHLFRANELIAYTLASIHNLFFFVNLVKNIRQSILNDTFLDHKSQFLRAYQGGDFVV